MDNITGKNTGHGDYGYQYDDLYRLTTADNPVQDDEAFTYDTVGNRLTSVDVSGDWTYNANNELISYDGVSYEYDANGNMVKKTDGGVVTSFVYNIENRLVEVWNGEAGTGSLTARHGFTTTGTDIIIPLPAGFLGTIQLG
jgi:YD repeat-containing protein